MAKDENEKHFVGQIAQKAFIENDKGQVLLVQYPEGDSSAGLWDLPGGRLNEGESAIDGLKREVLEEVGAEITVNEIIATHPRVINETFRLFIVVYRASFVDPTLTLVPEAGEIGKIEWKDKSEFTSLPLIDRNYPEMLKAFLV